MWDKSELRQEAFHYLTDGLKGRMIRAELAANGNNPDRAIANISQSTNEFLGQNGMSRTGLRVQVRGTVKSCKGAQVWYGDNHWDRPPDEIITWRTIFGFVAGEDCGLQLVLF